MTEEELVSVLIPRGRLTEVYRLLGAPPAEVTNGSDDRTENADEEWAASWAEEFVRICTDTRPSFVRVTAMMDILAKQPDVAVSLSEIANKTGYTVDEMHGGLTGFGRSLASRYGDTEPPWVRSLGPSMTTGQQGESHYSLDAPTAAAWLAAHEG